jgi:membrane-associated phospholipid phosphatase
MRTSEWIQTVFPALLAAAAWFTILTPNPLPPNRRWSVTLLAVISIAVIAVARRSAAFLPANAASILRDCLPVALFLIPYWQSGQFFRKPDPKIEQALLAWDQRLIPTIASKSGTDTSPIGILLELAYLFCYPLVPVGLLAAYLIGQQNNIQSFWLVVLVSTYLCYATTPLVPAYPPRYLTQDAPEANQVRIFNHWIQKRGGIHAISFPSGHVASAFSVALFLLHYSRPTGLLFLIIAIAISLGAVIGRYHYAIDVLLGAALSFAVFLATIKFP